MGGKKAKLIWAADWSVNGGWAAHEKIQFIGC